MFTWVFPSTVTVGVSAELDGGLCVMAMSMEKSDEFKEREIYDYVKLSELPKFIDLNEEVQRLVKTCSWWDLYGVDWLITCTAFGLVGASLLLMKSPSLLFIGLGIFIYGCCQSLFAIRNGHAALHNAMCSSRSWNRFWSFFFSDICGSFHADLGYDIHIKSHHPHTNIVGHGDSSTWKVPFLPAYTYMFVAPLLVPIITIPVVMQGLWGQWTRMARFITLGSVGLYINFYLLMNVSGFTFKGALLATVLSRMVLSIPYIHVNIFQHIGLPMYSMKNRPKKIYQMSNGVLNLPRNPVLDYCFGHSIISCHVEHHLFPQLSDNMCLKIKPIVSKFLRENGLPYHEDTYTNRMFFFLNKYSELMVQAPPITHFVGIQ
ncbi:hypothetical protein FSP39_016568 [Pinctada imbricata]|uniref:Fatty acid desaturase domain-containing protein n=1 Tax=Pinctada imbricata TaxID=66713 RepID=A0AA88YFD5_PINIB|nr:hypothetical protein FSP39_016568 [Pinctada imbricata]